MLELRVVRIAMTELNGTRRAFFQIEMIGGKSAKMVSVLFFWIPWFIAWKAIETVHLEFELELFLHSERIVSCHYMCDIFLRTLCQMPTLHDWHDIMTCYITYCSAYLIARSRDNVVWRHVLLTFRTAYGGSIDFAIQVFELRTPKSP